MCNVLCMTWEHASLENGLSKVFRRHIYVHFHEGGNVRILLKSTQMYSNKCSRMFIHSAHNLYLNLT
jgi:hypothetical protein